MAVRDKRAEWLRLQMYRTGVLLLLILFTACDLRPGASAAPTPMPPATLSVTPWNEARPTTRPTPTLIEPPAGCWWYGVARTWLDLDGDGLI